MEIMDKTSVSENAAPVELSKFAFNQFEKRF